MRINRKQMKADARIAMGEHKPSIYLITLAFLLITHVLSFLSLRLSLSGLSLRELYKFFISGEVTDGLVLWAIRRHYFSIARVLDLALACMSCVLSMGFIGVCLKASRRLAAGFGSLLDAFGFFFKVLWLNIVTHFFVSLWMLLLIVPGFIAAYRYSMAIFVLLDDPSKSVMDCIRESKRLTMGHKGELFVLDLSFLGWELLSVIPFVPLFTMPYLQVTKANYYNVLSGYQPEPVQLPEAPQDDGWWS